jgi:hypothetical protein
VLAFTAQTVQHDEWCILVQLLKHKLLLHGGNNIPWKGVTVYPECESGALWKACNLQVRPPESASEDAQMRYMKQPSHRDEVLDCVVLPRLKRVTKGRRLSDCISHLHRHYCKRLKTTDPLGEEVFLEICTECLFVITWWWPVGPKHVVRQRSDCVNKHNSCDCRYLSNRLVLYICLLHILFNDTVMTAWPPLWSSGQSSWLQIRRSRVRFPMLPDFLRSSESGTVSTEPREYNWGATPAPDALYSPETLFSCFWYSFLLEAE